MTKYFAAFYQPGPNWISGKPISQQPLSDHVAYLTGLHQQDIVSMGGPFADGQAGLVILAADDQAQAAALIARDPAVQSAILTAEVREWRRIV